MDLVPVAFSFEEDVDRIVRFLQVSSPDMQQVGVVVFVFKEEVRLGILVVCMALLNSQDNFSICHAVAIVNTCAAANRIFCIF